MTTNTIQLGEPVEHRGIVLAPLFPRATPRADYITFAEAAPLGFRISEVDEAGSVPQLLAEDPLDRNVLLYDGEELVGAKQNRILNVTELVKAHGNAAAGRAERSTSRLGSGTLCLDYVSRPEAFARLAPSCQRERCSALERLDGQPVAEDELAPFVAQAEGAPWRREPSAGIGEDVRLETKTALWLRPRARGRAPAAVGVYA